jgi:hypothetical protein
MPYVTKIKYIMYNAPDYSVLYNYPVRPVICDGCHFTHVENTWMTTTFH